MAHKKYLATAVCLTVFLSLMPLTASALSSGEVDDSFGQGQIVVDNAGQDSNDDSSLSEDSNEVASDVEIDASGSNEAPSSSDEDQIVGDEAAEPDSLLEPGAEAEGIVESYSLTMPANSLSGWSRVYGQNQLDTMREVSKTGWSKSDTVVIATDATYWDALSANSLAGALNCPVLLTSKNTLSSQTRAEIQRLGAKKAYVCGGPIAIASGVDQQIRAAGCAEVVRVYGQDQQGTSLKIAELVMQLKPSSSVIVATSRTFQDALSIAPYSYANSIPVLICQSGSNRLTNDELAFLSQKKITSALIVGGPIAVSSSVESQLSSKGVSSVERKYGQTEYETSVAIAEWELQHGMGLTAPGIATGTTFYDALTGAGLCGMNKSVLLIASSYNRIALTDFVSQHRGQMTGGYVFGGPIAVSDSVYETLEYCFKNGYSDSYATTEEKRYSAVYNYEFYRTKYPDIAAAYGNNRTATLNHFLTAGMNEKRQGCSSFSVQSYYNQYEDLRKAYGTNWKAFYQHYISRGKAEGRAGTGCTTLQGSWQYHNVAWAGQPNSYYCGPTAGYMILRNAGATRSASGASLTINNVARYMETDRYGFTSFNNGKFAQGMNSWLGRSVYATTSLPSYSTVRSAVLRSYENGYATAFDAHERRGGPHYNGHNNGTYSHIVVVDAYNKDTDAATMVDPGAGTVWWGASQKFSYNLSSFVANFVNAPDWGYRDGIGMYYAK